MDQRSEKVPERVRVMARTDTGLSVTTVTSDQSVTGSVTPKSFTGVGSTNRFCPVCQSPLFGRQKTCSSACRKKLSRG